MWIVLYYSGTWSERNFCLHRFTGTTLAYYQQKGRKPERVGEVLDGSSKVISPETFTIRSPWRSQPF